MTSKNKNYAIYLLCTYLFVFVQVKRNALGQDLTCCSHATGTCRKVCERISLVKIAADTKIRNSTILDVQKYCPIQLNSFWECLNALQKDISRGESWSGRVCCPIPQSETCRRACVTATSHFDLFQGCRKSDEIDFFSCLDRQEQGDSCCSNSKTEECRRACFDIFHANLTPSQQQRDLVEEACEVTSPKVLDCIKNYTKVTPATNLEEHLHCCSKSNKSKCREACNEVLQKATTFEEMLADLEFGGCGAPLPQEQFWQCFMKPSTPAVSNKNEVSRIELVGLDSAKWHCCQSTSNSSQCRNLCSKIFTKEWSTMWEEFHQKCLTKVSEEALRNCLDEVEEPCELGCDGLSFCTNFNNRPTELFRSCNAEADEAARNDVLQWQKQKELILSGLTLPLKNISKCSPNIWKAVACTLQIKPCSRQTHANQICRDVCLEILSQCVDWSALPPEHSPETVCAGLSPGDPDVSCISLDSFLQPADVYRRIDGQVSSPCKGDPCEANETCTVNKNCIGGKTCEPYFCTPGCKLGEVSEYMVPDRTYVRIPTTTNNPKGCLKICRCNKGKIEDCHPLPCVPPSGCLMETTRGFQHGRTFELDCNTCSCFAGEVICSKRQCESSALSGKNTAYTTLPCNCPLQYSPICGRNGVLYPSLCLAKCAGLTDADMGYETCQDPCRYLPCAVGQKCVPDPQVCLSVKDKKCSQFQCIDGTANCTLHPHDPVCDVDNREHANSCWLAHHNAKLAYRGPCLRNCRHTGEVCAINGKTYISECAAWADYVTVDYKGRCIAVGLIGDGMRQQCDRVQCAPLSDDDCFGITPPGACCPICAGAVRLLYSTQQINRALYTLQNRDTKPLTLRALLRALERQIQVAQCVLRGYLSIELDILVLVQTTERYPSALQLEACVREAEKIASLVNRQSPRVVSELSLSSLTAAKVVHVQKSCGTGMMLTRGFISIVFSVLLLKFL